MLRIQVERSFLLCLGLTLSAASIFACDPDSSAHDDAAAARIDAVEPTDAPERGDARHDDGDAARPALPDASAEDVGSNDGATHDAQRIDAEASEVGPPDAGIADARRDAGPSSATCGDAPPAFPGAEGFGACARGGRGGRVIHVTTLAARGPGSLQAALDARGPRTIVFEVSGVVEGLPVLTHGEVTIAGQTSPGGVTLRGLAIQGDVVCEDEDCPLPRAFPEDVIVRFVRLRPAGIGDDGLRLHHARRVVVDHVSIGNAIDEALQISFSRDVSVQHAILAETLTDGHAVEYGGILVNYSDPARGFPNTRISLHHDLLVRIAGRLPELSRENHRGDHGTLAELELVANVAWDPRRPIIAGTRSNYGGEVGWALDIVDQFFFVRATHPHALFVIEPTPTLPGSTVRLEGNRLSSLPALSDWQLANDCDCNDFRERAMRGELAFPSPPRWARTTPLAVTVPVSRGPRGLDLADALAAHSGMLPRDAMDRRLTDLVRARRFDDTPLDENPYRDALRVEPAPPPPADVDRDGMADAWERTHGLDPGRDDGALVSSLSMERLGVRGYTNLEVYLAELALDRMR